MTKSQGYDTGATATEQESGQKLPAAAHGFFAFHWELTLTHIYIFNLF